MAFSSLKDKALKLNNMGGIPFMEGREKGDLPVSVECTLDDYGFAKGENGADYVVLSFSEYPKKFFFGGSVVTDKMHQFDLELEAAEKDELRENGIPVMFVKKQNKKGKREYMTFEFFPGLKEE